MPSPGSTTARGYGAAWQRLCRQAYARYGYHCYWCQQPINPALPKTHRLSKTVDHTNPMATHGTALPSLDDVRPMHRACNTSKRHTVARRGKTQARPATPWHSRNW